MNFLSGGGTQRGCMERPDDIFNDGDCLDLFLVETCFCWTDACNSANLFTSNFVVVIFALAYYMIQ